MANVSLYGFTLLRNGIMYDYPFKESLLSLAGVCKKVFLALGESQDDTSSALKDLNFLNIIPTKWDESMKSGGLIFSQQTNIALNALKNDHGKEAGAWGIYLQVDEIFNEEDYEQIYKDIQQAENEGYDAVRFRYLHFWHSHNKIAIGKNWYPQEIRVIKLSTPIESWGDGQSFKNMKKIFESDVPIYHYGHVRKKEAYEFKKRKILEFHHPRKITIWRKVFKAKFKELFYRTLPYYGPQPLVMKERIESFRDVWIPQIKENVSLFGRQQDYPQDFLKRIMVKNIEWKDGNSSTPPSMLSPLSRPWPARFRLILSLSEQKVGLKKP